MFIRLFISSVSPGDVDEVTRLFQEDVVPAFEAQPGCLSIDLLVATQADVAGMMEGGAISRWETLEGMNKALLTREVQRSQVRVREMLKREPVHKVFEVVT